MHLREIGKRAGYCENTIRQILGRAEFASLKLHRGEVTGITDKHIERIKELGMRKMQPKRKRNRSYDDTIYKKPNQSPAQEERV